VLALAHVEHLAAVAEHAVDAGAVLGVGAHVGAQGGEVRVGGGGERRGDDGRDRLA
jgi:hypothetical protein